jgi:hypothetical protein
LGNCRGSKRAWSGGGEHPSRPIRTHDQYLQSKSIEEYLQRSTYPEGNSHIHLNPVLLSQRRDQTGFRLEPQLRGAHRLNRVERIITSTTNFPRFGRRAPQVQHQSIGTSNRSGITDRPKCAAAEDVQLHILHIRIQYTAESESQRRCESCRSSASVEECAHR